MPDMAAWPHRGTARRTRRRRSPRHVQHPHPRAAPTRRCCAPGRTPWWKAIVGRPAAVGTFFIAGSHAASWCSRSACRQRAGHRFGTVFAEALSLDKVTPASMLCLNLGWPRYPDRLGSCAWLHRLGPRWLTSVKPGMRWRFFYACLGLAVVALSPRRSCCRCSCPTRRPPARSARRAPPQRPGRRDRRRDPVHHAAAGDRGGVRLPRLPDAGPRLALRHLGRG